MAASSFKLSPNFMYAFTSFPGHLSRGLQDNPLRGHMGNKIVETLVAYFANQLFSQTTALQLGAELLSLSLAGHALAFLIKLS